MNRRHAFGRFCRAFDELSHTLITRVSSHGQDSPNISLNILVTSADNNNRLKFIITTWVCKFDQRSSLMQAEVEYEITWRGKKCVYFNEFFEKKLSDLFSYYLLKDIGNKHNRRWQIVYKRRSRLTRRQFFSSIGQTLFARWLLTRI